MFFRKSAITLLALLAGLAVAEAIDSLPATVKSCNVDDEACIMQQVQLSITDVYRKGVPELQIAAVDPMALEDIHITSGSPGSQFQFELHLKNASMHNFGETAKVIRVKGYTKDVSKPFKLNWDISTSLVEFRGKYEVNGKMLILPIKSSGDLRITLKDSQFKTQVEVTPEKRSDGHIYLTINSYKTKVIIGSGHLDATNLFNGDEELSKSTLKVLNDEWDTLSVDVEPKLTQAADRAFKKFAQKIWDVIPYDLLINID